MIIRLTKPKAPIQLPMEPEEPLTNPPEHPRTSRSPSSSRHAPHSPTFDLKLARVSLAIEVVMYAIIVCSTTGLMFALATGLGALAMGCGPAMQSVALTLYNRRGGKDSGKLFGALSVVQAIRCVRRPPCVSRLADGEMHGWGNLARRCLARSCMG